MRGSSLLEVDRRQRKPLPTRGLSVCQWEAYRAARQSERTCVKRSIRAASLSLSSICDRNTTAVVISCFMAVDGMCGRHGLCKQGSQMQLGSGPGSAQIAITFVSLGILAIIPRHIGQA